VVSTRQQEGSGGQCALERIVPAREGVAAARSLAGRALAAGAAFGTAPSRR
jgi:hypothetical protein